MPVTTLTWASSRVGATELGKRSEVCPRRSKWLIDTELKAGTRSGYEQPVLVPQSRHV